ncbi:maleate cis-trans isomerase family protein [Nocardioides sp. GXQ0305]|uniref:maleate cis-trans isomerase family protein n=1 Tax=Nocardioides sp. GXQ0305 TaxID=3423912 RepID=UPI003D7D76F7
MPTVVMLYPGHSAEDDYPALERRLPGVALPVVHTWEGPTAHDVAALRSLGAEEPLRAAAGRARDLAPDAVMWACTSGSFVYGPQGVHAQAGWVADAAGVPASSTTLALLAALDHLGARRVAVAATYPAAVTDHLTDLVADAGVEVAAVTHADVPSGEDAGRLDPDAVVAMVAGVARPSGTQAVVVPDTALRTTGLLPRLEAEVGVPVVTANQATAWYGLRLAGWTGTAPDLGTLFAR